MADLLMEIGCAVGTIIVFGAVALMLGWNFVQSAVERRSNFSFGIAIEIIIALTGFWIIPCCISRMMYCGITRSYLPYWSAFFCAIGVSVLEFIVYYLIAFRKVTQN